MRLPCSDENAHIVYNFTFFRNEEFTNKPFINKFDPQISRTIILIVYDFFSKGEDKVLLYFCFNDDGYGRHRNITFKKWTNSLSDSLDAIIKLLKHTTVNLMLRLLSLQTIP
jgi:hypothetical protein